MKYPSFLPHGLLPVMFNKERSKAFSETDAQDSSQAGIGSDLRTDGWETISYRPTEHKGEVENSNSGLLLVKLLQETCVDFFPQ